MLRHCAFCSSRIWPWQRFGWQVHPNLTYFWHSRCRVEVAR